MSDTEHKDGRGCAHAMSDEQLLAAQAENIANLALMWLRKDKLDAVEVHLSAASKLLAMSGLKDTNAHLTYHRIRASIAEKKGHSKAALRHSRAEFAICKRKYSPTHYLYALGQLNFGESLALVGNPKGAQIVEEGLELLKAADVGSEEHMVAWKTQTVEEVTRSLEKLR